jgi:enoyl-CoA hydratase
MLIDRTAAGVCSLTLDRAERGNALSADLVEALIAALHGACDDPSVHTVVLAGSGRHFCTGFDLSDIDAAGDAELLARFVRIEMLLAALWHAPVRTAAVVTGRAWGAGADLVTACDVRVAAPDASFRFPGAGFGIVLGSRRLAERVGSERARSWILGGVQIGADAASAAGLVSDLAEGAQLDGWHARLQQAPPVDRETAVAIRAATRADHRDADLAALVRSAVRPGLAARIARHRDRVRQAAVPGARRAPRPE